MKSSTLYIIALVFLIIGVIWSNYNCYQIGAFDLHTKISMYDKMVATGYAYIPFGLGILFYIIAKCKE